MTRDEALEEVAGWIDGLSGEYDASDHERERRFANARETLRALGVTLEDGELS